MDAREHRSLIPNLWLKALPHLKIPKDAWEIGSGKEDAINTFYTNS